MDLLIRLISYSKVYWRRLVVAALASAGVGMMEGAFAWLVEPLMKKIFAEKQLVVFTLLPFGIIILFAFRGICRYLNDYYMQTTGQLAIQKIRNDIYEKSMRLSLGFFNEQSTGMLMSRVLNDVGAMQHGVANIITGFFRDGLSAVTLLGVIFYRNWQLAIISFLVIPATVYPAQLIGKKIKRLSKLSQEKMGDVSSVLQETFSGVKVIKAFGLEDREIGKFQQRNLEYYYNIRKSIKYDSLTAPVMETITSFGVAGVIWIGGATVMSGKMTTADFFSFITAMALVYSPVKKFINSYNVLQRALGAAERVFEIIDKVPDVVDPPEPVKVGRVAGTVRFDNVSFSYDEEPVLQNISLTAAKGEIIALVGPSGGGKTTLVSLISRFYDVRSGAIFIDDIDIRQMRITDLLHQIALVDQETILFNDTIANNIRYGNTLATDAEVEAACVAAYAHDFILEMPDGYDTSIGDRGVRLSGGQRQRLCIARAILKDAPILILDEATSALDTESEQMVQRALENLMANRTTFVIAHRLSTIFKADKIVVMENGAIQECGNHGELLANNGLYKRLYDMQFKE
ncbi:MAG: ATP-binding cassette domain-containing protein [Geobacter sp.]|nr:ATP-binding cassette domain-containing protein [Geobacter sp.]